MTPTGPTHNIAFVIRDTAQQFRDSPAIIAQDMTLTYGKLWQVVELFAAKMQRLGIDRSSLVAVHTSDMVVSLASLLASGLLGARYVVASKEWFQQAPFAPTHFLRSPEVCKFEDIPFVVLDQSWSPKFADPEDRSREFEGFLSDNDMWLLLHSSGTTGRAKYMSLTPKIVFDRSVATADQFRGPATRLCSLYGCQGRPFFARAMSALLHGSAIVDSVDRGFLAQAGTTLVCGSPRHAKLFAGDGDVTFRFPEFEVAGSKLGSDVATMLLAAFDRVTEVYGAGETSKSFAQTVLAVDDDKIVKWALPSDSEVQIVDDSGRPCGPGQKGDVRVKNAYSVAGYIGNEAANREFFRNGWFYPGDIGHWTAAGELVIDGRRNEVINLRGLKIHPKQFDELLEARQGVASAACFQSPVAGQDDEMMVFLELEQVQNIDALVNGCHGACVEAFGGVAAPTQMFVVPKIPKTEDGSVMRHICQEMALQLLNIGG